MLYSRTASTPSNWELAPEGVMNWWVAFPPTQSTPLIRNRLVSCRCPATEKAGKPPPPPMLELLLTTPALSSRSRSKLRPFSGRSLTCCSVINPEVELSVVFTSGASSVTEQQRSEEHTSELQSHVNLVCRLLLEKKNRR